MSLTPAPTPLVTTFEHTTQPSTLGSITTIGARTKADMASIQTAIGGVLAALEPRADELDADPWSLAITISPADVTTTEMHVVATLQAVTR